MKQICPAFTDTFKENLNVTQLNLIESQEKLKEYKERLSFAMQELEGYRALIDKHGLSSQAIKDAQNMSLMKYALANGYENAEAFKKEMIDVIKHGKNVHDKEHKALER